MCEISTALMLLFIVRHLEILIFMFAFFHLYENLTTSDSEVPIITSKRSRTFIVRMNRAILLLQNGVLKKVWHRVDAVTVEQYKIYWRNRILHMHVACK